MESVNVDREILACASYTELRLENSKCQEQFPTCVCGWLAGLNVLASRMLVASPSGLAVTPLYNKFLGEIIYALLRVYGFVSSNGVSDRMPPTERIKPDPRLAR